MKKILIIEDDAELCNELKFILEDESFSVETAYNGSDGLDLIKMNSYDLILLDLKMPGMNGLEVLKIIKNDYKNIKVIVITARMRIDIEENKEKNEYEENILKLADMIIQKPFNVKKLLESISSLI